MENRFKVNKLFLNLFYLFFNIKNNNLKFYKDLFDIFFILVFKNCLLS